MISGELMVDELKKAGIQLNKHNVQTFKKNGRL